MLQLPPLAGMSAVSAGAEVYADDESAEVFYVVPPEPAIRRSGPDRAPVLTFVKYRSRPAGSAEATGGGFLELQTELVLAPAVAAAITEELRRRTGRPVRLRDPLYVDGTVALLTFQPQTGGMVQAIEGSAHPSLEPGLVASFSAALSRDGAALLWDQLRTSPSPVAVSYRMGMLARFPPATVRVVRGADGVEVDVLDWPPADPAATALRERLVQWAGDQLTDAAQQEIVFTARSAVVWPVNPQSTVDGLAGETRGFVEADLSEPWFQHIHVEVRLNARLAPDRIAAVTVRLRYGVQRHDTVFTDPDLVDTFEAVVDPAVGRKYRYQVEVQFAATSQVLRLPEVESDSPQLLVSLDDVGWVRREVSAQNVDWDAVSSVQVGLRYADVSAGVPEQDDVLALDRATPTRSYERAVYAVVSQPVHVQVSYVLVTGQRIEGEWAEHRGRLVLVPDVFDRMLAVRFSAPAGFATVAAHVIDCEHVGAGGRRTHRSLALSESTPTAVWTVGLLAGDADTFSYQVTSSNRDGTSDVGDRQTGAGSGTVLVGPLPGVLLHVDVAADLVDPAAVPLVTVTLSADGAEPGHLIFGPGRPTTQSWETYLGQGVPALYSWMAQYHLADGTTRATGAGPIADRALVLVAVPPA